MHTNLYSKQAKTPKETLRTWHSCVVIFFQENNDGWSYILNPLCNKDPYRATALPQFRSEVGDRLWI